MTPNSPAPASLAVQEWLVARVAAACDLPQDDIDVQLPLSSLGLESLTLFTLAGDLASWLGHDIPLTLLWEYPTIAAIAAHLGQHSQPALPATGSVGSVVTLQSQGDGPPLFLVHDVSGTIWCYAALIRHLGNEQPVHGFQVPVQDDKPFEVSTLEELSAFYVAELRRVQRQGPYHLGGFSMGGVVAFEMARQLSASGDEVALLALIDTYFPGLKHRPLPFSRKISNHFSILRRLSLKGKVSYIRDRRSKIRRSSWPQNLTPEEERFRDALFHSQVSDQLNAALKRYCAQPYSGSVTLLRARWRYLLGDDHRAWRRVAPGEFKQHFSPGSHGMIVTEPYVAHLAALLKQCLRQARAAK